MNTIFSFGEKIPEYEMKVLNEREVRASAGILFLFAIIAFLNSWLIGNFVITKAFVVIFLVDFSIRVLINPKYAPTLIIGRFFVRHQKVEYVGAPQKRFAWAIGLVLAVIMFYLIVLNNMIGPFNLLVCIICLTLLFFEAAFGICLGCKIYNLFHQQKAQLCPGNVCAAHEREAIQKINPVQIGLVILFFGLIYSVANSSLINNTQNFMQAGSEKTEKDCQAPDWAIKMGHEEKWKLHNGCKNIKPKTASQQAAVPLATSKPAAMTASPAPALPTKNQTKAQLKTKDKKDCVAPDWAIKMGHEEMWKLHNGCKSSGTQSNQITTPAVPTAMQKTMPKTIPATQASKPASMETSKDCIAPDWAINMGHEEMWKQHNCK